MDRAITTTYKLLKVTMSLSAAFWLQFGTHVLLPAAVTCVRQITVFYPSTDFSVRYSNVTRSCMGLQSLWKIVIFRQPEVGHFRYRQYGTRPIAATAGIFVLQNACCIHVRLQVQSVQRYKVNTLKNHLVCTSY